MKSSRIYRKLASAHKVGFTKGGWVSLHVAADHLLLRTSSGFLENYRRFYFADIEAITVRRTTRGSYWNVALTVGLVVSLVVLWQNPAPHLVSGAFAGMFAFLIILNVSFGATCVTQLQTRVQTQALPIRRVRQALRVLGRIFPTIEAAQAEIAASAPVEIQVQPAAPVIPAPKSSGPPPLPGEKQTSRGSWIHVAVFTLLLLSGAIAIVGGLQNSAPLRYVACAGLLANLVMGIIALVYQRRYRLPSRPGVIVWISVIAHSILLPAAYSAYSFLHSLKTGQRAKSAPLTMQVPPEALGDLPGFDMALWICGMFCVLLAVVGCFVMLVASGRTEPGRAG